MSKWTSSKLELTSSASFDRHVADTANIARHGPSFSLAHVRSLCSFLPGRFRTRAVRADGAVHGTYSRPSPLRSSALAYTSGASVCDCVDRTRSSTSHKLSSTAEATSSNGTPSSPHLQDCTCRIPWALWPTTPSTPTDNHARPQVPPLPTSSPSHPTCLHARAPPPYQPPPRSRPSGHHHPPPRSRRPSLAKADNHSRECGHLALPSPLVLRTSVLHRRR